MITLDDDLDIPFAWDDTAPDDLGEDQLALTDSSESERDDEDVMDDDY